MSIFLYSHGGSGNHGCEAIVRGTKEILPDEQMALYSFKKAEDEKYGLGQLVNLQDARISYGKLNIHRIVASLKIRLFKDENYATKISINHILKKYGLGDIGFSIGGDNYCYPGFEEFGVINKMIRKCGAKTVLWGCSVEPSMINDIMLEDLKGYDLAVARESITYDALKRAGVNVILSSDPAFCMKKQVCNFPFEKSEREIVGINVSPHILTCEKENGIAYKNYVELVKYILENTDYSIALIPHVVWDTNDDRKVLHKLYEDIGNSERVFLVEDHTAPELKYIISKCSLFVGARTHATIAAYSTCVPTLVVGYSVKARGIAKDLFGQEENYVIPVQSLDDPMILTNDFKWLESNQEKIRLHLEKIMPEYIARCYKVKGKIMELI